MWGCTVQNLIFLLFSQSKNFNLFYILLFVLFKKKCDVGACVRIWCVIKKVIVWCDSIGGISYTFPWKQSLSSEPFLLCLMRKVRLITRFRAETWAEIIPKWKQTNDEVKNLVYTGSALRMRRTPRIKWLSDPIYTSLVDFKCACVCMRRWKKSVCVCVWMKRDDDTIDCWSQPTTKIMTKGGRRTKPEPQRQTSTDRERIYIYHFPLTGRWVSCLFNKSEKFNKILSPPFTARNPRRGKRRIPRGYNIDDDTWQWSKQ